jgi:hypothetical protein
MVKLKKVIKSSFLARYFYPRFYSQTGEDVILGQMVGKRIGTYLDIGSGLPIWGSNTYSLYRKGWRGITVDPIRDNVKWAKWVRPRDRHILGAISDLAGISKFYEFEAYEYSTLDQKLYTQRVNSGLILKNSYSIQMVKAETIQAMLPLNSNEKGQLLVLSIDAEGYEQKILNGFLWETFSPDIIIIEELQSPLSGVSTVRNFLEELGYLLYAFTGYSSIYKTKNFEAY